MTQPKISRFVLIGLLFVDPGLASAADGDANLETARYLLRASEAHEQSAAISKGRLRATFNRKTVPVGLKYDYDVETHIDCVWDSGRSMRKVYEIDNVLTRKNQKIAGSQNVSPSSARYRVLITPDRMCQVLDPNDGEKRNPYVRDWPYLNMPELQASWRVLPYESASQYSFEFPISRMLQMFIDPPLQPEERPERVISEKGDSVILKEQYPGGGRIEFTFSRAWGDRMVAYTSIPGGKMVNLKFSGSFTWNRDVHGEIYLQEHTFEQEGNGPHGPSRSTLKFRVEEYDSQPVIGADELTFGGLKLPDDAPFTPFGNNPNIPGETRTVGGKPFKAKDDRVDKLIDQLKTRGFARPERTK